MIRCQLNFASWGLQLKGLSRFVSTANEGKAGTPLSNLEYFHCQIKKPVPSLSCATANPVYDKTLNHDDKRLPVLFTYSTSIYVHPAPTKKVRMISFLFFLSSFSTAACVINMLSSAFCSHYRDDACCMTSPRTDRIKS